MTMTWTYFGIEDAERAQDDHRGTEDDMNDQRPIDHRIGHFAWWFLEHVVIDGFDTKTSNRTRFESPNDTRCTPTSVPADRP